MKASTIAPPEMFEALTSAAAIYLQAVAEHARKMYPNFDQMPETMRYSILITQAVQGVLSPASFLTEAIDLDAATFGAALAVGTQTAEVPDERMPQIVTMLLQGVTLGRQEAHKAKFAYPTQGSMN